MENKNEAINELLDEVKKLTNSKNDAALAKLFGISRVSISNYRTKNAVPDNEVLLKIHWITGKPLQDLIVLFEFERAKIQGKGEKIEFWGKLKSSLAIMVFVLPAQKMEIIQTKNNTKPLIIKENLNIMRTMRGTKKRRKWLIFKELWGLLTDFVEKPVNGYVKTLKVKQSIVLHNNCASY